MAYRKAISVEVVIFGGGIPITFKGNIIGAIGASAGTVEQDIAVVEAAVGALAVGGRGEEMSL